MGEKTLYAKGAAVMMKSGTRSSGRTEASWNRFSAFARWRRAHSVSHWPTSFHDLGPKRMKYAGLGRDHGTAAGAGWWSAAMPLPWAAGAGGALGGWAGPERLLRPWAPPANAALPLRACGFPRCSLPNPAE